MLILKPIYLKAQLYDFANHTLILDITQAKTLMKA